LVFKALEGKGTKSAIILSSILFAVVHIGHIAGGSNIVYTIIQVVYAFVIGIVFAEVMYLSKSLIPVILWHFLHDFFSIIQNEPNMTTIMIFAGAQIVILALYAIYLFSRINIMDKANKESAVLNTNEISY
jgi:membrane protease YdiL (CAAX protease family)